ncbi:hypothetical protein [Veillonella magna]|nr:hypothetical protein [Veillonella magna]
MKDKSSKVVIALLTVVILLDAFRNGWDWLGGIAVAVGILALIRR